MLPFSSLFNAVEARELTSHLTLRALGMAGKSELGIKAFAKPVNNARIDAFGA